MLLENQVLLDLDQVQERFNKFISTFPDADVSNFYFIHDKLSVIENLDNLAKISLEGDHTTANLFVYYPIFLDLASRWITVKFKNDYLLVFQAFSKIVTLYPLVTVLLDVFLSENNEHFLTILQNPSSQSPEAVQLVLLAYYRILYHDRDVFVKFINPEIIYSLLNHQSCASNGIIKIISTHILSILLDMSEIAHNSFLEQILNNNESTIGHYESKTNVNYKFLLLNEANRISEFSGLPEVQDTYDCMGGKNYYVIKPEDLDSNVISIYGKVIIKQVRKVHESHSASKQNDTIIDLVPTHRSIKVLRQMAKYIQSSIPVMLLGSSGSGKTFLVNELAKFSGCHDSIIKIHLGEQTDAKLLIGTYTSGEKPGTFEWRSGILTNAVKEGRWVLIEDIDKAPTEVLSILLTLLEKRELIIPSRGDVIKAATGFQLISTTCINHDQHPSTNSNDHIPNIIGKNKWKTINLDEPDDEELITILSDKFYVLKHLIPKMVLSYKAVKSIYSDPRFISLNKGAHSRVVSVRDLVKLSYRLNAYFHNNNIVDPNQLIESSIYDNIFSEAIDCFVGAISEPKALEPFIHAIGEVLDIPFSRTSLYLKNHVPAFENFDDKIHIGRSILTKNSVSFQKRSANGTSFATTNHSLRLMEQISVAIQMTEPVLLVGETGTGKTTIVQQIAKILKKPITIINVSQQTETGDLLGGYKPVNSKSIAIPIQETFESLFSVTFSMKKNERFYNILHKCFNKNQWKNVVRLWKEAYKLSQSVLIPSSEETDGNSKKHKKRKLNENESKVLIEKWDQFKQMVEKFEAQSTSLETSFIFNFVEGSLVNAVKNGEWLLLDELNLASADTLESIADLLNEGSSRSLLLSEKGDTEPITVHPDFRIFGCMNPATDVGKRDLPSGIRSRFTEIYVHSPDRDISDLLSIIDKYISKFSVSDEWVGNDIAELYLEAKRLSEENKIVDGSNQKPHFSIRTLTRTLLYVSDIVHIYGLRRSLYDGFCMSFLTLLDRKSEELLLPIIEKFTLGRLKNKKSALSQVPTAPGPNYITFKHYLIQTGSFEIKEQPNYIITPFVEKNMLNLVRASSGKRFPILIQGPTSAGKTSMIRYLADITGHKFVRINNHEHTDLQEYLGTYMTDDSGKLLFQEGILVEALRNGYWIVLDELNLAPTDVLEALNRLLDDNRELFIPETQEVIHPHPDFMLFATQNPPGIYGGRKVLSRAFRNRFLELHFDDIPEDELEIIIKERCQIAPTYAKKLVEVYRQLSIERSAGRVFEQKNSFATLRDLFRWALRDAVGYEQLAANGYMLLAERCRTTQDKQVVKDVLERIMKVKLNMDHHYKQLEDSAILNIPTSIVWTKAIRRLAVLVSSCMKNNEPILLVGETGCGKTTIFQVLAQYLQKELIILNAHQNTETSDILGAQRPVRNRSEIQNKLATLIKSVVSVPESTDFEDLLRAFDQTDISTVPNDVLEEINELRSSLNKLFEWCDGPLIHALKSGNFFLLDEISLADDSVLERLNSVLEPERSLLLAEKGTSDSLVTASDGFQFFATMNPGGDYGKKELSPALRNRFTEIWVPSMEDFDDVELIVQNKLNQSVSELSKPITQFSEWFGLRFGGGNATNGVISLRDILAWVEFINSTVSETNDMHASLVHGASMVFIDALGTNNTAYLAENEDNLREIKKDCLKSLSKICGKQLDLYLNATPKMKIEEDSIQVDLFKLHTTSKSSNSNSFNITAPTTASNLMRVVRAMQVNKPILLEGSPGVGKTSLITALADLTGNNLTRINLSEQTDLIDLFGSDVPGEATGEFVWRDAPFLRAMQRGEWVLLDEMNLASQSVLEGLNACLDHRGEAYIPELDKSFERHPGFIVFAAQNPQYQGSGRKGLPKSFINRFSVVYVDMLLAEDLLMISSHLYPNINKDICSKMIHLMSRLETEICKNKSWGLTGAPWEFNLRDTLRWLKVMDKESICENVEAASFVDMIIVQRFRSHDDRQKAQLLCEEIFGPVNKHESLLKIHQDYIQVNNEVSKRNTLHHFHTNQRLFSLQCNTDTYESVLRSVNNNWPLILVGPSNAGKTEIIRYLASITGAEVDMFSLNSDIDSMDILGGYEQVDIVRQMSALINELVSILRELVVINLTSLSGNTDAIAICFRILHITKEVISKDMFYRISDILNNSLNYSVNDNRLPEIIIKINKLRVVLSKPTSVKFEWFDGMLVKAVEKGQWLILDNANLCSPSVLDRLNSLLETNGNLIINECSEEDGKPRIVKPHPNFRLFLTMDPKFGELSRAMRNRGIEIFVDDLSQRMTSFDMNCLGHTSGRIPLKSFVPSYLSKEVVYSQICDTISLYEEIDISTLMSLTNLSFLYDIETFKDNITNGGYIFKSKIVYFTDFLKFLNNNHVPELIDSLLTVGSAHIARILDNNSVTGRNENISPILNTYLETTLSNETANLFSKELVYVFICLKMIFDNSSRLQFAYDKSLNGKINELTYLELSAAVLNNRHVRNPPKIPIYEILLQINNAILQSILDTPLFSNINLSYNLWKLLIILDSIFECAKLRDEARLRVYKDKIVAWIEEATLEGIDVQKFLQLLESFNNALNLERGQSISIIWNKFRKVYPSNKENWKLWNQLMELSRKFDDVIDRQFSESYPSIVTLREIFTLAAKDILDDNISDVPSMLLELNKGIEILRELSNSFLRGRNQYFRESFDLLSYFLFNNKVDLKFLHNIAPLTSLTTEQMIKLELKLYPHEPVLDILWRKNSDKFDSNVKYLFTTDVVNLTIDKSSSLKCFSGNQLPQTLSDAKLLLKSSISASKFILEDKYELYGSYLREIIIAVITGHVKSSISNLDVLQLQQVINLESELYFQGCFNSYLRPALLLIDDNFSMQKLGEAWLLFGVGLLLIFAPNLPYDPAVHDYVNYDIFERLKTISLRLVKSWESIRTVIIGDQEIYAERVLDISCLEDKPENPQVYRPQSSIDNLFDEWSSFFESTVSPEQVLNLQKMFGTWSSVTANRSEMFQQNTSQFLNRLKSGYQIYGDLNDIFTGYILAIKFGMDLLTQTSKPSKNNLSITPLWSITPTVLTNTGLLVNVYQKLLKLLKKINEENFNADKILVFFMGLFKLHNKNSALLGTFNEVLQSLYMRWTLRRIKKEQSDQEQASIFKYEDKSFDVETEFKTMFPTYDEDLSYDDHSTESSKDDIDELYYSMAKAYMFLFSDKPVQLSEIIRNGSKINEKFNNIVSCNDNYVLNEQHLSSLLFLLGDEINSFNEAQETASLDFYRSSSISESQKAISVINNLWTSVNELLKQWPEHATLFELDRICKEFLEFPSNTPLARQIQKIEQIYTFVVEWEKYAALKVSLSTHSIHITNLIVSWRRLELSTWNGLFESEDERIKKNVGKWWFHLFETIIVATSNNNNSDNDSYLSLLTSLNAFFTKTSYGEYSTRIHLVKSFLNHVELMKQPDQKLINALSNSIKFYEQFIPIIEEHISRNKKILDKDMKEIILLASWKDVNIDALKQSSRRSHNNLYKVVRKYRDVISGDVQQIIEAGVPFTQKVVTQGKLTDALFLAHIDIESCNKVVLNIPSWSERSETLKNMNLIEKNMKNYVQKISTQKIPNLQDLVKFYRKEADRLKSETPSVLTKENKKLIATLRAQKAKLFSDALKELRRIGLKTSFRKDIHNVQSSATAILSNSVTFSGTLLEKSDAYYYRIIDLLPRLRSVVATPSDDIVAASIEKGMAINENLVFSLLAIRSKAAQFGSEYESFKILYSDIEKIYFSAGSLRHSQLSPIVSNYQYINNWLPVMLDYLISTLKSISSVSSVSADIEYLEDIKSNILTHFKSKINAQNFYDDNVSLYLDEFKLFLHNFMKKIKTFNLQEHGFIYNVILEWLEASLVRDSLIEPPQLSIKEIDNDFRKIHTSILLSIQRMMSIDLSVIDEDDDKWLQTSSQRLMKIISTAGVSKITHNMKYALDRLKSTSLTTTDSIFMKAIIGFTLPLFRQYYKAIASLLNITGTFYEQLSYSTFHLCILLYKLAKDGFCSPDLPSEDKEDNNLHDGTGLGDGEGANNNSKDIDQDEDLTEDAQTANNEKQDNKGDDDKNENDDAVEMEGDMAGDLEDLSDQNTSNSEDEDDQDEQELDEEIDDLNDDDPNSIDEKMWDEEASENSKEKDTDKNLESTGKDEDVEANENQDENADNKESNSKEENNLEDLSENEENKKDEKDSVGGSDGEEDSDEEDVGEQEDEIRDNDNEGLESNAPEVETMDLPEDMNLDSDNESDNENVDEDSRNDMEDSSDEYEEMDENSDENVQQEEMDEVNSDEEGEENDIEMENDINDNENNEDINKDEEEEMGSEQNQNPEHEEQKLDSDEELLNNEEIKKEETQEQGDDNIAEGLEGLEDNIEEGDVDIESAIQQQSGSKGEGADSKDTEEQDNIGTFGETQQPQQDSDKNQDTPESSREEAKETLKQLGDSLKEFHKRRQEIRENSNQGEENESTESKNTKIDEFEHIDGANTNSDTQAMGSANQEDLQAFNEDLAIDDDEDLNVNEDIDMEQEDESNIVNDEAIKVEDTEDAFNNNQDQINEKMESKGGFIGEKKDLKDIHDPFAGNNLQETEDDLDAFINEVDKEVKMLDLIDTPPRSVEESRRLWKKSEIDTAELVARLSEQLRLILEPTLATKLRGDYKTGKRLNMKRIIPYIASQFRKDKIWLRRTKPSKRKYQIMIALDDSKSMSESNCVNLAFDSLCLVSKTLTQLESGGLSIVKFGETTKEVHSFNQQFSNESGIKAFQWFGFQESKTDIKKLVSESIKIFEKSGGYDSSDEWKLQIVISDGICEDHETVQRLVRRAREKKIMLVFVIIDGITSNESIMDMGQVNYVPDQFGNMKLEITKYLDTFPFEFYVVVHDVTELPEMLSTILRQYFSDLASS